MKSIILFITAIILYVILFPVSVGYVIFKALFKYLDKVSISIDMSGNVLLAPILNDFAGDEFGKKGETVSYVLGKNEHYETLKPLGVFLVKLLNLIDKDHCKKAYSVL